MLAGGASIRHQRGQRGRQDVCACVCVCVVCVCVCVCVYVCVCESVWPASNQPSACQQPASRPASSQPVCMCVCVPRKRNVQSLHGLLHQFRFAPRCVRQRISEAGKEVHDHQGTVAKRTYHAADVDEDRVATGPIEHDPNIESICLPGSFYFR